MLSYGLIHRKTSSHFHRGSGSPSAEDIENLLF